MPQYDPNYPLIRRALACPRCTKPKDTGLVICWPCNRELKLKHDGMLGRKVEALLITIECFLTAWAARLPADQPLGGSQYKSTIDTPPARV